MLSADVMQDHFVKLARKQRRDVTYKWIMHKEVRPCKIIALRVERAHLGYLPPKSGSRLGAQLLIRFDTLQVSLRFYVRCILLLTTFASLHLECSDVQPIGETPEA